MSKGDDDLLALVNKFAEAEKNLAEEVFLAPYVPGAKIVVKVKQVVYELSMVDSAALGPSGGFALFRISAPGKAVALERATRAQTDRYLKLLPRVQLVLIDQFDNRWWGLQANTSDSRFSFHEPVPIMLVDRGASFEQVNARFDGRHFWCEGVNRRRDPSIANKLREALSEDINPARVHVPKSVPQELFAYSILWFDKHPESNLTAIDWDNQDTTDVPSTDRLQEPAQRLHNRTSAQQTDLERLRQALSHAGARLERYWQSSEGVVTVSYVVDGNQHSASVRLDDLSVVSSGICLSGQDSDFDLTSLVGVMREFAQDGY